jgi:acyl-CoA thioesterase-2
VDPIRDGRSFSTRSVKAIQGGKCIFTATMSFQRREKSVEHSVSAPDAPDPESLPTAEQYLNSLVTDDMSESQKKLIQVAVHMHQPLPLDVRLVNPLPSPFVETPKHDSQLVWIRARIPQQQPVPGEDATGAGMGDLERVRCGSGMESYMHRCIAAFASDWTLCLASLRPHGLSLLSPRLKMLTSIDHSMWYHHPFDATKWMLYQTDSPVAMGGRSLNQGRLFDQQGRLCVSVAQEALVRVDPAATEAGFRA